MERFVFETTQGAVLDAAEEAALMDFARVRGNSLRPCAVLAALTVVFTLRAVIKQEWANAAFTLLLGLLLCGFFWLPMLGKANFRANVRSARARRGDLTDAVRGRPVRFVFEDGCCRMLDGKGTEAGVWNDIHMLETRESEQLFWLPIEDTSVLLPKAALKEGTEEAFRAWLKSRSRRYRFIRVTDRTRQVLKDL